MNNAKLLHLMVYILTIILGQSCTEVDITMPKGPKGDRGMSAYEFWKENVENGVISWPKKETEITDFFKYLKGKDGLDGKSAFELWKEEVATGALDNPHRPGSMWPVSQNNLRDFWYYLTGASGENGQTPHIGNNMNWWIGNKDTGIRAQGRDGQNGEDAVPPVVTIGDNGNWLIDGVDTGKPSRGEEGVAGTTPTVTIGENGNWVINGKDTGKAAIGGKAGCCLP